MGQYRYRALANGLRTDHPIPGLPFADDSHIPVDDARAVEATGRRRGGDTWGRTDPARPLHQGSGWVAYTTDPGRHDLAWLVRWHPEHGRSVILYRDDGDVLGAYEAFQDGPLLFRAGGYWWDGTTWYRPSQVFDWASEEYFRRPVPSAATVTAADILAGSGDADLAAIRDVFGMDPDAQYAGRWEDDLALWARRRGGSGPGLERCVTGLTAPELATESLIGTPELADITGIAPSTLRAYVSRGEGDVPLPQAVIAGRSLWSRPVAQDWTEQRQRSPEGVDAAVSAPGHHGEPLPAGEAAAAAAFTRSFVASLWDYRPFRARWALRWRTKDHVQEVAAALGADAARYAARDLIPTDALAATVRHAFLDELATGKQSSEFLASNGHSTADETFYGITPKIARMLGWLALHRPHMAGFAISEITGEAESRLGIPRRVTTETIRTALDLDGDMGDYLDEFLARVLTPATDLPASAPQ